MDEKTKKALETARSLGYLSYAPQAKEEPLKTNKKRWWQKLRKKKSSDDTMRTQDVKRRIGSALTEDEIRRLQGK